MKIRIATEADAPQIIGLKNWGTDKSYLVRIDETRKNIARYLLVDIEGEIVGQAFLKYYGSKTQPDYPDVEDILVKEEFRNRGIGTRLIAECENQALQKGFTRIGLCVNPSLNSQAKDLYERLGYKEVGTPPYLDGVYNGTEDWVVDMEKELK